MDVMCAFLDFGLFKYWAKLDLEMEGANIGVLFFVFSARWRVVAFVYLTLR